MSSGINGKYVVVDDPSNSSNPNRSGSAGGHDDPTVTALRMIVDVWLALPLAIMGIVGNVVSFFVLCHMRKSKLRAVTTMLQALAVSDTLVLVFGLLGRSLRVVLGRRYDPMLNLMYPWLMPTVYILRLANIWLTVLLTLDRYIAVCHPLHAQRLCTTKKTSVQIFGVSLLSLLFCLPRFFEGRSVYNKGETIPSYVTTELMNSKVYSIVYRITLFLVLQYVIPTIALIYLNARVVLSVRRSSPFPVIINLRRPHRGSSTRGSSLPSTPTTAASTPTAESLTAAAALRQQRYSSRAVTIMVVVVVTLCIVCHVVAMVSQVIWSVQVAFNPSGLDLFRRHISNVTNLLLTFNSAINFLIYCAYSRNFRLVLARWWSCRSCHRCHGNGVDRSSDAKNKAAGAAASTRSTTGTKSRSTSGTMSFQTLPFGRFSLENNATLRITQTDLKISS